MNLRQYFILNWKRFLILLIVFGLVVVLYDILSVSLGYEETTFFIVVVLILPIYIIVFLVFSLICWILKKCFK